MTWWNFGEISFLMQWCWNLSSCGYFHEHFGNIYSNENYSFSMTLYFLFSILIPEKLALWDNSKITGDYPACNEHSTDVDFVRVHFTFRNISRQEWKLFFSIPELLSTQFLWMEENNTVNSNGAGVLQIKLSLFWVSTEWIYNGALPSFSFLPMDEAYSPSGHHRVIWSVIVAYAQASLACTIPAGLWPLAASLPAASRRALFLTTVMMFLCSSSPLQFLPRGMWLW